MMATRLRWRESGAIAPVVRIAIIETNVALSFVALILTSYQSISDCVKLFGKKKEEATSARESLPFMSRYGGSGVINFILRVFVIHRSNFCT